MLRAIAVAVALAACAPESDCQRYVDRMRAWYDPAGDPARDPSKSIMRMCREGAIPKEQVECVLRARGAHDIAQCMADAKR